MTIVEFAAQMDVSRQTVHTWLNGTVPDASRLARLHALTKIPIKVLIGRTA